MIRFKLISIFDFKFWLLSFFLLGLPFFLSDPFEYEIFILAILNSIIVLGLNLLLGYTGQISLAHGAFYIVSPYLTVILMENFSYGFFSALFLSLTSLVIASSCIAFPILKLKGHYLAMATLGIGLVIYFFLNNEVNLTGGPDGLIVPPISIFKEEFNSVPYWYFLITFIFLCFLVLTNFLIRSPWGIILKGIKENEKAMLSVGVKVHSWRIVVFSLSIFMAGVAGNLYAFYAGFISPSDANFTFSVELLAMVIIGGVGNIYGGIMGSFLLTALPQLLSYLEEWKHLILGAIIIFIIIFLPQGIGGLGRWFGKK